MVNKFVNQCIDGLNPTFDGQSCVKYEESGCSTIISGCANCSTLGTNICAVCNVNLNFKPKSVIYDGISRCSCIDGLDYYDGQCIPPIPAVTPFPPTLNIDNLNDEVGVGNQSS